MDTGIDRKVANEVPIYIRKVAEGGVHARFDTVTNTERGINMRFKHASRRLRVPYIHPRYVLSHTGVVFAWGQAVAHIPSPHPRTDKTLPCYQSLLAVWAPMSQVLCPRGYKAGHNDGQ